MQNNANKNKVPNKGKGKPSNNKKNFHNKRPDAKKSGAADKGELDSATSEKDLNTKTNDISWYNRTPLFEDATNFNFNTKMGDPFNWPDSDLVDQEVTHSVPGVMRIDFIPGIGFARDSNSPVNRAFNSMYQAIYSRTSGALQIQQAELSLFVLAMSSIMLLVGCVKRAIGISQMYTSQNYYYPDVVLTAMGIDPASVKGLQNDVRQRINQVILNFNGMEVPDFVDVFKRHYTLCVNLWADEDSIEAQLYSFVPAGYYLYHDTSLPVPGYLEYKPLLTSGDTVDINVLIDAAENCLESWRNSSNFGLINGAIQRAYPQNTLVQLERVAWDYITVPVYDKVMLWQISNSSGVGNVNFNTLDVTQDPVKNLLLWKPSVYGNGNFNYLRAYSIPQRILNAADVADIGRDFIMEATRLVTITVPDADTSLGRQNCDFCGTEIITSYRTFNVIRVGGELDTECTELYSMNCINMSDEGFDFRIYVKMCAFSKFRNAPIQYFFSYTEGGDPKVEGKLTFMGTLGDLNKYGLLDYKTWKGLQDAAMQSLFLLQATPKEIK